MLPSDINKDKTKQKYINKDVIPKNIQNYTYNNHIDKNDNAGKNKNIVVNMLNVQYLTQSKLIEIETHMSNDDIFFLLETHQKRNQLKIKPVNRCLQKFRLPEDKKGGGFMILWKNNISREITEVKTKHSDINLLQYKEGKTIFFFLVVYMATNDNLRNITILSEIRMIIKKYENNQLLILGDFNGHLGFLGPQKLNLNGQNVLKLMNDLDLILINDDQLCQGEITWQQNNYKSAIDFVLANTNMYQRIEKMVIDEQGDKFNISDHNLITVQLKLIGEKNLPFVKNEMSSFYKINDVTKEKFLNYAINIIDNLEENELDNFKIDKFEQIIVESATENMKVNIRRAVKINNKKDPIWFSKEIDNEISKKRNISKLHRKCQIQDEKKSLWNKFQIQKLKVKRLVNNAIEKHEKKITNNILNDKNRNKKLYGHINTLKGHNNTEKKKTTILHYKDGSIINETDIGIQLENGWKPIYQMRENKISDVWNIDKRAEYTEIIENQNNETITRQTFQGSKGADGIFRFSIQETNYPKNLREHLDYAFRIDETSINPMEKPIITLLKVENQINSMKNGKSPGPDGMKIEIYKTLLENKELLNYLVVALNNSLESGNIPDAWKISNTILIQKKRNPIVTDLRPIALTNVCYKIFMGILKNEIEKHIKRNNITNELQMGSTKDRRVSDNLFILNHCIEKSFKNKSKLYVIAIDFYKAFDSIDRAKMISILKNLKINSNIIEIISKIYSEDKTNLILNGKNYSSINIKSGIRQGCNCSALLFILVTYHIICKLQKSNEGYTDEDISIPCLFYMDDGLLIAKTEKDIEILLKITELAAKEYGLILNRNKCKAMIFNNKQKIEKISNIDVVEEILYLGIIIRNQKKWYLSNNKKAIEKANKLCNHLFSVLGNSCNRMLIGKTYYKGLALPNILYGQEIVIFNKNDLDKLQIIENRAFRFILQVPTYTAIEYLRGEVGASDMQSRDMKCKINYLKHALTTKNNDLLNLIMINTTENKNLAWIKLVDKYLDDLNLTYNDIINKSKEQINSIINKYDNVLWKEKMNTKSTLTIYRDYKEKIDEIKWFRNGQKYSIMMRARSNTLKLKWRNWGLQENKICDLCSLEIESLEHFLIDCPKLQIVRQQYVELQKPTILNKNEIMAIILLLKICTNQLDIYYIDMINNSWNVRNKLLIDE